MMIPDPRSHDLPDSPEPRFTDAEARQVLARAAERERALGAGVSAAQLRDAALEAGIPAAAFDQAVAEVRAAPGPRRRAGGLLAAVIGLVLLVGAGSVASRRDGAPAESTAPATQLTPGPSGDPTTPTTGPGVQLPSAAITCGAPEGVPGERLRSLAGSLYPEVLSPANRHRSLVVAIWFDAGCHVKAHTLARRGTDDGVEELLRPAFPAAYRSGWQVAGIADAGPWSFEKGNPWIAWGVERAPR